MSYYEDEILREIEVGEKYTSRQIKIFMLENNDVLLLIDSDNIVESDEIKYKVVRKIEKYIHKVSEGGSRTHSLPNNVSRIYELEKVY